MKKANSDAGTLAAGLTRRVFVGTGLTLALARPALAAQDPGWGLRTASTPATRSIHSGHSLTDAYLHNGPWPGSLRKMAESIGVSNAYQTIIKSTIPGSPIWWRWENRVEDSRPNDPSADARTNIADFDTLVITEGGPPARVGRPSDSEAMSQTLDHLCRYIANTIENGNGGKGAFDIALWSIWPSLTMWRPERPGWTDSWQEFTDFRAALPEYGRTFRYFAGYSRWKIKQFYPDLPDGWRVWLFPGHMWMQRLWDDISEGKVPNVKAMQDLFSDDIHANDVGGYGLACFMLTCLYQVNLAEQPRLFQLPGVPAPLRDYFTRTAWEIATTYAPVGMGGTVDEAPVWTPDTMTDPLPDWTPALIR